MHALLTRLTVTAGITAIAVGGVLAQANQVGIAFAPETSQDLEAPTNLIVESVVGSVVTLRWTPPIVAPRGYVVEGGLLPGTALASVSTHSSAAFFSFAMPDGSFYLRVRALVGATTSVPSNDVQVRVNLAAAPSAPVGLLGLSNGSELALAWQNTFAEGTPSGITLEVTGDRTASIPLPHTNRFSFPDVPPGTYSFAVRGVNGFGNGGVSNTVTLSFPGTCSTPAPPTNFAASGSGVRIYASWSPPATGAAPTGYVVNVDGAFEGSLPTTELTISGSAGPGTYSLSVAATNACGTSAATPTQTVTVSRFNGVITVGEEFSDYYGGGTQIYSLTAPSDGTLVLRLGWNPAPGSVLGVLGFRFADRWFGALGRVSVSRGQTYVVAVNQDPPWDYGLFGRFWLWTTIE